jgi:hypothetical protein
MDMMDEHYIPNFESIEEPIQSLEDFLSIFKCKIEKDSDEVLEVKHLPTKKLIKLSKSILSAYSEKSIQSHPKSSPKNHEENIKLSNRDQSEKFSNHKISKSVPQPAFKTNCEQQVEEPK